MNYRYQFLVDLYRNRKFHPDNRIWLYRYEPVIENGHYVKVYLYCKDTGMNLEEVTFQFQHKDTQQTVSVTEFHKIRKQYQPYLTGCLIPVNEDDGDITSLAITSYRMNGTTYPFAEEDMQITLSDEQQNRERNALLLQQMDITIMPWITDTFYLCACGNIHRIGEPCPNCHRSYQVIQELVEKGQEELCKEALLKKYCTLTELEKRNYKSEQWIFDIQEEAKRLHVALGAEDYEPFLQRAKSTHRKAVASTIFLSVTCALGIIFSILLYVSIQTYAREAYHHVSDSSSDFMDYGDDINDASFDDNQYSTCSLYRDDMSLYTSLTSHDDAISDVTLTIEMSEEQLGVDPKQLDQSMLDEMSTAILHQYGLKGTEKGIDLYISTDEDYLQIVIFIDVNIVENKTLKALQLESINQLSYSQVLAELQSSGMDCE